MGPRDGSTDEAPSNERFADEIPKAVGLDDDDRSPSKPAREEPREEAPPDEERELDRSARETHEVDSSGTRRVARDDVRRGDVRRDDVARDDVRRDDVGGDDVGGDDVARDDVARDDDEAPPASLRGFDDEARSSAKPSVSAESQTRVAQKLAKHTAVRLAVLTLFLAVISLLYLRGQSPSGFSSLVAFLTVAAGFALSGAYAWLIRRRKNLARIGYAQLVTDQLLCTSFVYITGGVTSGGISLYGLTCLTGAIVLGKRGALTALVAASVGYVSLAAALLSGILVPPPDQRITYALHWSEVGYPMFANLFALGVVTALASYLAERLRATGGDLAAATARAEQAEQLALLGKLAAGLAHEIRNPLGSIAGSIELIGTSPALSDEDRQLCEIIQRETARLNDLVGDMLDLSRARPPQIETVDLARVAREVVILASQSGRGRDVRIECGGSKKAPIRADAAQLRQVVWNLVRNAVQVSAAGDRVAVDVKNRTDRVELFVHDAGPGIPEDARARLFDAFFTTRSHGTGVGLAVVKRILDQHGFAIEVLNTSPGATFKVIVPRESLPPDQGV